MANPKTYSNQSVNLTPTSSSKLKTIKVTASSSIMTNYEPSRSVTANHKIKPVQDINGNPIMFSVGTNNHLYAIVRDADSSSGWNQYDVTNAIGDDWSVEGFNTYRFDDNTFVLAVSLAKNNVIRFFATPPLSADPKATYWSEFSKQLVERQNGMNIKSVASIRMGLSNNSKLPTIIADATIDGTNYDRYVINADTTSNDNLWTLWALPQNAHRTDDSNPIVDVAIGKLSDLGLAGTYTLYYVGDDLQLTFDTIEKFNGQILSHAMTVPSGAQALATVVGDSNGNTELYVAGNGVYRFPVKGQGNTDQAIKIADSLKSSPQTELEVLADANNIAVWYLDEGVLSYVHGTRSDSPVWTDPMPISGDVGQIAAIRNTVLQTNEIFDVDADNNLMYFYQDPTSTIWRKNAISLSDTGKATPFECYTTVIHLEDANGTPITKTVNVSASGWVYATVNGANHILDTDTNVAITPDPSGAVTVITKTSTASTPIISIGSDSFKEYIDVNPQNVVNENLKNFTTSDSVSSAKTQDGQQVLPSGSSVSSDQLANTFSVLTNASDSAHGSTIVVRNSGENVSNKVNPVKLAQTHTGEKTIAVSNLQNGSLKMHTGQAAMAFVPTNLMVSRAVSGNLVASRSLVSDAGNEIEAFFGDVWNAISNDLKKVGSWVLNVVEDGLQFVVHLAEGIVTFILDTIEKIYEVLSWVLKQIEMGLAKLIQWLGQLLGWDDILTCHKIITNGINQVLDWMADGPQKVKTQADNFFNSAAQTLTGKSLPQDIAHSSLTQSSSDTQSKQSSKVQSDSEYHKSPAGGFAKYHMVHSGPAQSNTSVDAAINQVMKDFMTTVENVGTDVYNTTKTVLMDIVDGISSGNMNLTDILEKVASDAILGTLTTIEDFTNGVLNIITDVIKAIKAVLNYSIEIPFITGLYKLISGDDKFTILNAFSLIISVPIVTLMKVTTGTTPFANGTLGLDDTSKTPDEYISLVTEGSMQPAGISTRGVAGPQGVMGESRTVLLKSASEENSEMTAGVLYSQIGGGVFIISEAINDILAVMATSGAQLGSFAKWVRTLLQACICGSTLPVVKDSAQDWRVFKWILGLGGLSVLYCSAVDPTYGPIAGVFNIIFGVAGLVVAFGIPITVSINGNEYQITMAWVAFVGSLGVFAGNLASGIGKFDPEPDTKEILTAVAAIGFAVKVIFDIIRELVVLGLDTEGEYRPFYA